MSSNRGRAGAADRNRPIGTSSTRLQSFLFPNRKELRLDTHFICSDILQTTSCCTTTLYLSNVLVEHCISLRVWVTTSSGLITNVGENLTKTCCTLNVFILLDSLHVPHHVGSVNTSHLLLLLGSQWRSAPWEGRRLVFRSTDAEAYGVQKGCFSFSVTYSDHIKPLSGNKPTGGPVPAGKPTRLKQLMIASAVNKSSVLLRRDD